MDFDKYFFHHNVFGYGESINDSFRPPGPPAEPLLAVCWLRKAPESEVSHTLAVHWWILINCFIIMLFLVTEIRLVRISDPLDPLLSHYCLFDGSVGYQKLVAKFGWQFTGGF